MARENDISALGATVITVAPGATLASLIQFQPGSVANVSMKTIAGSFIIFGIPGGFSNLLLAQGGSIVGSSMVTGQSFGYLLGQAEVISAQGNPIFYVGQIAAGATGTLSILLGKTGLWYN